MDVVGEKRLNTVKAYNLFKQMSSYPELMKEMRRTFLEVLAEREIITATQLEAMARTWISEDGIQETVENLDSYSDSLIDLHFATYIENSEDYVNLVRKRDRARNLVRILGTGSSSVFQIYEALREFATIPKGEVFISKDEAEGIRVALINHYISSQLQFIGLAKHHLTMRDVDSILERTFWDKKRFGKLGGKAAGMILASLILLPTLEKHDPELEQRLAVPETWYINSALLSTFVDQNALFFARTHKYKDRKELEEQFAGVEEQFRTSNFSQEVIDDFRHLLEEVGEHPIIVRSSSHLEDSFGLSFSGKYESVFLANQGDIETRLDSFISGVKQVLASMYRIDPILYRRAHGLLDYDEQMAMIVQKVVGRRFGPYFFPFASGVLFSHNSYRWSNRIESEKGLTRMVFGLGTRAVDRVGSDYPRMIALSHPKLRPEVTPERILRYSQKMVDVLNLERNCFETVDLQTLCEKTKHPDLFQAVSIVKDGEVAPPLFKNLDFQEAPFCITFDKLIQQSPFLPLIRKVLDRLVEAYGRPVDVEFAWDDEKLYILQCRTLSTRRGVENVKVPRDMSEEKTLFRVHSGLSDGIVKNIEYIIFVDPRAYNKLESYDEKVKVARLIGNLNHELFEKRFALLGPGRWGSKDINLGVQVNYGDISNARLLAEIALAQNGMTPEVSYGTHFFQDLVESDIAIFPIFPDNQVDYFDEAFLLEAENKLAQVASDYSGFEQVVRLLHVPSVRKGELLHVILDDREQNGLGYFGVREI
jgi:hypothetical protein